VKAAALGYQGVMLMAKRPHLSVLDWSSEDRARLRRKLESLHLTHTCLAGYTNFTGDLQHTEVPQREIQISYVSALSQLAADTGARTVRIFTGYQNPAAGFSAQWNLLVDTLGECARRAAEYGVTLGVQNHHDMGVGYESLHDLIVAVQEPNCRAMFDAWAPALQNQDLASAAAHMAPLMVHTTVADYQLRPRFRYNPALVNYETETPYVQAVPMGDGFIDYPAFLGALVNSGFSGTIAYEMCSPLLGGGSMENLDRYAARFLEYLAQRGLRQPQQDILVKP
jgi:sugar phosphate isomerase/epimerase